jgi:ubiquinone/menaquinone biosynthesis C-methylase UbiE
LHPSDAESLIAAAVPVGAGVWADFGAGEGTFTRVLAHLLEDGSRIYAVDRDASSLSWVAGIKAGSGTQIVRVIEDFAREFVVEESREMLDGMLFANSLHFVQDQVAVLARLVPWLRPGGRVIVVEYDQREASRWVPYPISVASLKTLAQSVGLTDPVVTGTRLSEYQGIIYSAAMDKEPVIPA